MRENNEEPLISIYVPCYNVEKYVEQCVESILKQSYRNLEILLVNNLSKDGTEDILNRLKEKDDRIQVVQCTRQGLSCVRNTALPLMHGEYITSVDADDYLPEKAMEILYRTISKDDCDLCMGAYYTCNETGEILRTTSFSARLLTNRTEMQRFFLTEAKNSNMVWAKLYRREILNGIVYPEGLNYEDQLKLPEILEHVNSFVITQEPVYYYRLQPDSITHVKNFKRQQDGITSSRLMAQFYEEHYPDLTPLAYDHLLEMCFYLLGMTSGEKSEDAKELRRLSAETAKQNEKKAGRKGIATKGGLFLTHLSPRFAAWAFHTYSKLKNKTE